jgi:ferredoxin-NADP reductase
MSAPAQTVSIVDILQETFDTQTLRLASDLPFKPGQALALTIPGDPKKRYYSISSSPTEKNFRAITVKVPEKERPLFDSLFRLNKGSPVEISGPYGSMTLTDPLKGPYFLLAAGSGVTPFRSMVKYILDTAPQTESWLIHSVKTPDDLIFKEEFLEWTKNPAFHFVPTFTRWNDTDFKGDTGRIGEKLLRKHITLLQGTFYVCGPGPFVKDMEQVLMGLKIPAEHIHREQW